MFLFNSLHAFAADVTHNTVINDNIRIYFTPGSDCENNIISEINKSKEIDIAVYSITNINIYNALLEAKNRNVKIRIITDRQQSKIKGALYNDLKSNGFNIVKSKIHRIEHNKFAIFDDKRIVSGSYNWTNSATKVNSENCIFFDEPNSEYTDRFQYLWELYNK